MKGRPKEPARTRRRTGNRRKPDEAPKLALVPQLVAMQRPPAPDDLPEEARPIWDEAIAELVDRGLRAADLEALRQMCTAAARARQAAADIATFGLVVEGQRGPMVNPLIKIERDASATYLRIAEQFGLTIASRMRLGLSQLAGQSMLQALHEDIEGGKS